MSSTIRPRTAAAGIAAVAVAAALAVTAGPVSAVSAVSAAESATTASQAPQSSGYPTDSLGVTDLLVTAYGIGDDDTMKRLATGKVVTTLTDHGDAHAKRWHRTAADAGAGHTWVSYTNLDTREVMTFGVRNEAAANGGGDAVREVTFAN
ncbi:hypothetical protein [Brevibacterium oceani]|uniref:hypothetical protein n=1 Tax=Brevibacterium oceani TaxID=358099 RepID=UPI001B340E36|nr:hypothetical protein [Brevibacterium oceani]